MFVSAIQVELVISNPTGGDADRIDVPGSWAFENHEGWGSLTWNYPKGGPARPRVIGSVP
jgi:hypothetical protein